MKNIQLRGAGARYTNETASRRSAPSRGTSERRRASSDDHRTGTWQFEGWVNVKAGVNGGCIHQVFKFLMIVVYPDDGGELRQHSYQQLAATGLYDKWVRVNTIHDPDAGRADVYIDGTWRGMTDRRVRGRRAGTTSTASTTAAAPTGRAVAEREVLQGRQGRAHGVVQRRRTCRRRRTAGPDLRSSTWARAPTRAARHRRRGRRGRRRKRRRGTGGAGNAVVDGRRRGRQRGAPAATAGHPHRRRMRGA